MRTEGSIEETLSFYSNIYAARKTLYELLRKWPKEEVIEFEGYIKN